MYVFDLQVQADIDYEIGNWYVSTHPGSPFSGQVKVARLAAGERHTLNNAHYAVHALDQPSHKRIIEHCDELSQLLGDTFGIRVPTDPQLRAALEGLIAADRREP